MGEPTELRYSVEIADQKLTSGWSSVALRLSTEGALNEVRIRRGDQSSHQFRIFDLRTREVFEE